MNEENFLPLTLEEYQSLIRLKKAGVRGLEVFFCGSDGGGSYYAHLWFVPYSKIVAEEFKEDFKRIEKYLYRNLDKRDDISFDGNGCQGHIDIDLTEDQFSIGLKTQVPAWTDDVCVSAKIAPATELEALVAEVLWLK
jgi:hypothetical protein